MQLNPGHSIMTSRLNWSSAGIPKKPEGQGGVSIAFRCCIPDIPLAKFCADLSMRLVMADSHQYGPILLTSRHTLEILSGKQEACP